MHKMLQVNYVKFNIPISAVAFQATSIDTLLSAIVEVAQKTCPALVPISRNFTRIFSEFAQCYKGYSGGVMSDEDINDLG